jgi:hypothetical protein
MLYAGLARTYCLFSYNWSIMRLRAAVQRRANLLFGAYRSLGMEANQGRRLYTVKQIAARHPGISERTLRHWIFNAKKRRAWERGMPTMIHGNGFDSAMVRAGRKILIDEVALFQWLESSSPFPI